MPGEELALLPFLGGVISGVSQAIGNNIAVDTANKANKELWQQQMKYNSPIEQMARLKEAGLNPNLVYGHGAVNLASSPPSMGAVNYGDSIGKGLSDYQAVNNQVTQSKVMQGQIAIQDATTKKLNTETINTEIKNLKDAYDLKGTLKGEKFNIPSNAPAWMKALVGAVDNTGAIVDRVSEDIATRNMYKAQATPIGTATPTQVIKPNSAYEFYYAPTKTKTE